eukprot:342332-Prymnesium_polylepis.2
MGWGAGGRLTSWLVTSGPECTSQAPRHTASATGGSAVTWGSHAGHTASATGGPAVTWGSHAGHTASATGGSAVTWGSHARLEPPADLLLVALQPCVLDILCQRAQVGNVLLRQIVKLAIRLLRCRLPSTTTQRGGGQQGVGDFKRFTQHFTSKGGGRGWRHNQTCTLPPNMASPSKGVHPPPDEASP